MPTILLLAENPEAGPLKADLESMGHRVIHQAPDAAAQGAAAGEDAAPGRIDIVAIDTGQPPRPLVKLLRERADTREAAIVLLVDEAGLARLDLALELEDFILKPLRQREVEARIRRIARASGLPDGEDIVKVKDLVINRSRYEVRVKGAPVDMTLKEYELLKHLVTHAGRVFTRADLLDSIWGYDYYGGMRTVDVHIRRLRSKLGAMGETINTVRGVGYSFTPP